MNVTLRQIEAFLAVSEHGSFTRAADRLHMSQSAISVMVGELERTLQLRLLDRTTRRVELTEAGRQFGAQTAKVVSDLHHAVRTAHGLSQRLHGRLTVFAPPLLAMTVLPAAVAAHRALHPGIAMRVVDGGTDQLVAQLRAGEVDLAVGTVLEDTPGLSLLPLAADHLMLFCLDDHRLARQANVSWEAIAGESLIALTWKSDLRRLTEQAAREAGATLAPAFEVGQITTALAMVAAGLGVAVLPSVAGGVGLHPALVGRPVTPVLRRTIHAVHRQGRTLPPAAQSFVAVLREELGRMTTVDVLTPLAGPPHRLATARRRTAPVPTRPSSR